MTRSSSLSPTYIVTGAAGTIGQAISASLLGDGAFVYALDINADPLEGLVGQWGDQIRIVAIDVTDETEVKSFVASLPSRATFHGLVNNVGAEGSGAPVTEVSLHEFVSLLTLNVTSAFLVARSLATRFVAQRSGAIVNVGSISGLVGSGNDVSYTTAKHALVGLTRALAAELGPFGVRVNCVCPGPIESPLMTSFEATQGDASGVREWYEANTPLGRYGHAHEVADLVRFLLSHQAGFISGAAIPLDGGLTATGRVGSS